MPELSSYDKAYKHIFSQYQRNNDLQVLFASIQSLEFLIEKNYVNDLVSIKPLHRLTVDDLVQ